MMVVGIDPGLSGAMAFIVHSGSVLKTRLMPTLQASKTKREIDERMLFRILTVRKRAISHVFIEKVHAMKKQGVTSCFNFGCGWGMIRGICTALELPYTLVHSTTWKKAMCKDLPKGKDVSIIVAKRLWPGVNLKATDRSKKDHSGLADALCIAEWGRRQLIGQTS